jgi:cytochrome c
MTRLRPFVSIGSVVCSAIMLTAHAAAQVALPQAKPVDGATLFKRQCATCHATTTADPPRQGPELAGIVGRKAGSVAGFKYSPGFANADFAWSTEKLDAWLSNPQAVIPGAIMPYRQANADARAAIITFLKELH